MSIHVSLKRAGAVGLAGLVLLFGAAQPAAAKQDWLGWLEEFSGPGPFQGFELSVEFACLNVSHKDTVKASALFDAFPELQMRGDRARASFQQLSAALVGLESANIRSYVTKLSDHKLTSADIDQLLAGVGTDIENEIVRLGGPERADGALRARYAAQAAVTDWNRFQSLWLRAIQVVQTGFIPMGPSATAVKTVTTSHVKKVWLRSCWGAKRTLDDDRVADRTVTATRIGDLWQTDQGEVELYRGRRDWETGLVIDAGWFWSEENRLFDPEGTRTGNDEEPQLRVVPLEFLAHHKLSPAIDVGAGLGVSFFHTDFHNDPWRPTKSAAFYLVPLSVVVRPGRLFTDKRWASALGYRVGLRYFGNLEGKDFGRPPGDLLPGQKYFKQNGEFVWGAAAFFDLWSAAGR